MQPYPSQPTGPALPGRGLILLGLFGGGVLAFAALAPIVAPGLVSLGLTALGEVLLVLALFGLQQRAGGALWLLSGLLMGLNGLLTLSGIGRMTIGFGLLGGFTWLVSAAAWGLLGLALLVRRHDGHPGLGAGAGLVTLVRAACAFFLFVVPFFGFFDPTGILWTWRAAAFFNSALVALFCATAMSKPAAPRAPAWQPPPYGPQPPYGQPPGAQPPPYGQPPPGGWQPPPGGYR
jgi:hypothetical protein